MTLNPQELKHLQGLFVGRGLIDKTPRSVRGMFSGGSMFYRLCALKNQKPPAMDWWFLITKMELWKEYH